MNTDLIIKDGLLGLSIIIASLASSIVLNDVYGGALLYAVATIGLGFRAWLKTKIK